ncbi:integrase [Enterobacter sp. CCUG 70166]|uniref:tyrosine-type recombinase/integrase n=1 Tax=Enterobacter sp. CCUG 70166 TaxID=2028297 RepID=UPI001CDD8392|nr:integrase arm-type DNA-binding domain-containing protein [Enterobacter sp. CCUG 70166]MCA2402613.1 integrase [Enterobacter sp. CCUG 70166]
MLIKPLSHAEVKNAKVTGKDYSLHDGFGLLLFVSKAGGKTWRFRYQHPDSKRRQTLTIGRYPEFSLAEAREERDKARRLVARGIDPNEEKRGKKAERLKRRNQTFKYLADSWLKVYEKDNKRESTILYNKRVVNNYVVPAIGEISVHDISAENVINAFRQFSDRPATLGRAIDLTRKIIDFAVNTGVIKANPVTMIHKAFPAIKSKPQKALEVNRLPDLLNVWEKSGVHTSTKNSLIFLILTMVRPIEAINAEWSEIDFENALWTIPGERMKSGREHIVPLSSHALEVLSGMKKIKKSNYIFYGAHNPENPIVRSSIFHALKRLGFSQEMTLHGFRAMWSTLLNEEGFNPDVIEAALAHKSGNKVRDTYNRSTYLEQRAVMMQWVGDFVDSARNGIIRRTSGMRGLKVVNE